MRALIDLLTLALAGVAPGDRAATSTTTVASTTAQADQATSQTQDLRLSRDGYDRMTVAVEVGDSGPYRFLVDTGAERTVISRQLAERLGLVSGIPARIQSVAGGSDAATVDIPALRVSSRQFAIANAPTLEADHIGADGMLGVDSLAVSQVLFDFRHGVMEISPSRESGVDEAGTIVVEARRKHGRLMFTHAAIEGRDAVVVIDTGSQISIGNPELRRKLLGGRPVGELVEIETVVGEKIMAEIHPMRTLELGGVTLKGMIIAFTDAPVFRQLELDRRPALLLGMNALRGFDRVSIDFATRRVRFVLPGSSMASALRLATN